MGWGVGGEKGIGFLTPFFSLLRRRRWSVSLALALLALCGVTISGAAQSAKDAGDARQAVMLSAAYQDAETALDAEHTAVERLRSEPDPASRAVVEQAEAGLPAALSSVATKGGKADRAVVSEVLTLHDAYVAAVGSLAAAGSTSLAASLYDKAIAPTFTALKDQLDAATNRQRNRAVAASSDVRAANQRALVLTALACALSLTLVAVAGSIVGRARRRLELQSELNRHQALHDHLTGLPNRALFYNGIRTALRRLERTGGQVAVMLLDLDRFKDVNDTLGHQYGDVLLTQVAERLSGVVRSADSVARLGGDEFGILLEGVSESDAVSAADRITATLHEPFLVNDISLDMEASIGIGFATAGSEVGAVLRHADVAMYEAKSQHQTVATYELTRDDHTVGRLKLLGDLRRAISNSELVLHFQPKVSAKNGALHSVEALVRWNHPTGGLVPPDEFIPIAETTAVIHPLTTEIMRQALMQVRAWLDRGWNIQVAVNISSRSLLDMTFPGQLRRQLDTIGVPATCLSLEITESAIMSDPAKALAVLRELDAMGISLSIDDFGTGYSSMAYLKTLPVRELKIDRSFVVGMATDESDVVLVQSAVDLGHNLGFHVVAEGVEDAETRQALSAMGCDLIQGYHICRPATAADLDEWLRTNLISTSRDAQNASR